MTFKEFIYILETYQPDIYKAEVRDIPNNTAFGLDYNQHYTFWLDTYFIRDEAMEYLIKCYMELSPIDRCYIELRINSRKELKEL